MTRTLLIATVAALAITAPAQAGRGDDRSEKGEERAAKAQARQAERAARDASPQAAERPQREQRMERPQREQRVERFERPQREQRMERFERPQREQRVERFERPQREQRVERFERPQREQRLERFERPQRERRVRIERAERPQRERFFEQRAPRIERRERSAERIERRERSAERIERRERSAERFERRERSAERSERRSREFEPGQRLIQRDRRDERFAGHDSRRQERQAERLAKLQQRAERQTMRSELLGRRFEERGEQRIARSLARVGKPLKIEQASRDWYDDYASRRYATFNAASPQYASAYDYNYDYDDGYLYQVDRGSNLVRALFPLLGGAFSVGQPLPIGYQGYNVPYAYRSLYYDTPDYGYRYGDGAIYRVDPSTQLIQAVVALLTGQRLGVGQLLPAGYDAYNVPYAYRDTYYDTDDAWYRYDDGYIYQVDPYTRMIEGMQPLSYGGYAVGYPVPAYANYGGYGAYGGYPAYAMPYGYQNLYNSAPGYNYQYANGGIYQVDPKTRLIAALVALVTGTNLGVGQLLPAGYDAYNVPYAYRDTYFDSDDSWYRYDDGNIYQVDPYSRRIEAAFPVDYGGYAVGYPVPAAFPGYPVPDPYQDLYYAEPGQDYRYFDGGIYQVDPDTQIVRSVAALLTGQSLGVGQRLPLGYDAYNVPYAYRDRYADSDDSWYRYADGNIYQVDPQTRLIQAVIDAIV